MMEWVAARQPPHSQPDSARRPVALDSFHHVFRAGRGKPAGRRQERRDPPFIETQSTDDQVPHLRTSLSTSAWMASKGAFAALRRGLMTISHRGPAPARARRTASRIRRRMRLRTTALPIALGTVKPKRAPGGRFGSSFSRQKAEKSEPENRMPCSYTRRKSGRRRSREVLGNGNSGTKDSGLVLQIIWSYGRCARR